MTTNRVCEKAMTYGLNSLSDKELISLLLRSTNTEKVAENIVESLPHKNIYYLAENDIFDLLQIEGMGQKNAAMIKAAIELGKRIQKSKIKSQSANFSMPEDVAGYYMEDMRYLQEEHFMAIYVTTQNRLITAKTLTIGTINASLAKSREVFKNALKYNAAAVILAHNHPSGDPEPSKEDIAVTKQIVNAGAIMEIPVLDHVIFGDGDFVSLSERGYI